MIIAKLTHYRNVCLESYFRGSEGAGGERHVGREKASNTGNPVVTVVVAHAEYVSEQLLK